MSCCSNFYCTRAHVDTCYTVKIMIGEMAVLKCVILYLFGITPVSTTTPITLHKVSLDNFRVLKVSLRTSRPGYMLQFLSVHWCHTFSVSRRLYTEMCSAHVPGCGGQYVLYTYRNEHPCTCGKTRINDCAKCIMSGQIILHYTRWEKLKL